MSLPPYIQEEPIDVIKEIRNLTLQMTRLNAWISGIAVVSVFFVGFVGYTMKATLERVSNYMVDQITLQRDLQHVDSRLKDLEIKVDKILEEKRNGN